MSDNLLQVSYDVLVPLASRLRPSLAYAINSVLGRLGKSQKSYASYLYDRPAAPPAIQALVRSLHVTNREALSIVKRYFLLETRCEIENRWLGQRRHGYLDRIIHKESMRQLSESIHRRGPSILLSAHCTYYFMVLWALRELENKVAFMMMNPRAGGQPRTTLQKSIARSADALGNLIPVLFTDERNTVNRAVGMLKNGYSIMMLLDVPGYRERGMPIRLFDYECWIPKGCLSIHQQTKAPVVFVFPYAVSTREPYDVHFSTQPEFPEDINLQRWADELEGVVRKSPASWPGWFCLGHVL